MCDGTAFLNCLTYYQSELVPHLLRLQVLPIALTLLSEPSARAAEALRELVRLVQALSCCEEAAELICAQSDSAAVLLALFVFLSDDQDAIATCEILENVWQTNVWQFKTVAALPSGGSKIEREAAAKDFLAAALPRLARRREHDGGEDSSGEGGAAHDAEMSTTLGEVLERCLLLLHPLLRRHLLAQGEGAQEVGEEENFAGSAVWWLVGRVIERVLEVLRQVQREWQAARVLCAPVAQPQPRCGTSASWHADSNALAHASGCVQLLLVHLVTQCARVSSASCACQALAHVSTRVSPLAQHACGVSPLAHHPCHDPGVWP